MKTRSLRFEPGVLSLLLVQMENPQQSEQP
jgi:hypothetical protein